MGLFNFFNKKPEASSGSLSLEALPQKAVTHFKPVLGESHSALPMAKLTNKKLSLG